MKKVLNVRTHVGGLHGKTSYDAEKDRADMELHPVGVLIKSREGLQMKNGEKHYHLLIPYSNCTEVLIDPGVEEKKRGPGRPAGAKIA